jgi:tellurite resistance protein TehA-like permease
VIGAAGCPMSYQDSFGYLTYEAISEGPPDLFTQALIGYAVFQLLILTRLFFWIREQPFTVVPAVAVTPKPLQ